MMKVLTIWNPDHCRERQQKQIAQVTHKLELRGGDCYLLHLAVKLDYMCYI